MRKRTCGIVAGAASRLLLLALGLVAWGLPPSTPLLGGETRPPLQFVVPRTSAPPKIDGVIEDAEWKDAAAMTGVVSWHEGRLYNARQVLSEVAGQIGYFHVAGGPIPDVGVNLKVNLLADASSG